MIALGEDPAEYDRLYQDLVSAYQPTDALWAKQVEDLARLYWNRARLDRAKEGLQRKQLERLERQHRRFKQEMDRLTQDAPMEEVLKLGLRRAKDSPAKFKEMLCYLETLSHSAEQRDFSDKYKYTFEMLYGSEPTWQGSKIFGLFDRFVHPGMYNDPADELAYQELCSLVREEVRRVREEYDLYVQEHVEISAAERDASLAPSGSQWTWIIRQENALERAIDRKVKILMRMRGQAKRQKSRTEAEIAKNK